MTNASLSADERSGDGPVSKGIAYYAKVLSEADGISLREADAFGGLTAEISLMRMELRRVLEETPDDTRAIQGFVRVLMQAIFVQQRLHPFEPDALANTLSTLFEGIDMQKSDFDMFDEPLPRPPLP